MNAQQSELFDLLDGFEMTKSQHDWLERRFENMTVESSKSGVRNKLLHKKQKRKSSCAGSAAIPPQNRWNSRC